MRKRKDKLSGPWAAVLTIMVVLKALQRKSIVEKGDCLERVGKPPLKPV